MKKKRSSVELSGVLWLNRADHKYLAPDRINLLEKIDELGSITKAAKAVGISYKTAWDTIDAINTIAEKPVVERLTGGKGGGGTTLTAEGKRVIAQFKAVQEEYEKFLENMENRLGDSASRVDFQRSARNTYSGKIVSIERGEYNAEVTLAIKDGPSITAVVPNRAMESFSLRKGKEVYATVKASSVLIGTDLHNARISARNILCGNIAALHRGSVNTEVSVEIGGGNTISALITHGSAERMELKVGDHACAVFKASNVIIGTD